MPKKVAVLVRERQHEALRMAVGMTLDDNMVSVFVIDRKLPADENTALNLESLGDMKAKIFSNNPENNCEQKSTEEIARALSEFDVVIPY
jgi:hypothetical protein